MPQNSTHQITKRQISQLLQSFANSDGDNRSLEQVLQQSDIVNFYKSKSNSLADFKTKLTAKYRRVLHKIHPAEINNLLNVSAFKWRKAYFQIDEANLQHPRHELVAWFYKEVMGSNDLVEYRSEIEQEILRVENQEAITLTDHVHKLSVTLLKNFGNLTPLEMGALKLCLSGAISLISTNYKEFFEKHIPLENFLAINEDETGRLDQPERDRIGNAFEKMKEVFQKMPKRVAFEVEEESIEDQVESVMTYIYKNVSVWQKTHVVSEAFYVDIIKQVMNFVFIDTDLQIASGENCSNATKLIQSINECLYSSQAGTRAASTTASTNNLCGRKIDMIIATPTDVELAAFEFKKKSGTSRDSIYQESKCVRINISIEEVLRCFNSEVNTHVGMDWCGPSGYIYVIKRYEDVYVAKKIKDLKLPMTRDELLSQDTKEFIFELYNMKKFYLEYYQKLPSDLEKSKLNTAKINNLPAIVHSPKIKFASF